MKRFCYLTLLACLTATLIMAQTPPSRSFMLGPVAGIDQVAYPNFGGLVGVSIGDTPGGLAYGVGGAYGVNRWLIGAKLLYRKRAYQRGASFYEIRGSQFPVPLRTIGTNLNVLSVPISVGYRVAQEGKLAWYLGGNLALEYLMSTGNQVLTSQEGTVLQVRLPHAGEFGPSFNIGFGVQTTFSYKLTPRLDLQLEPAVRYYPGGGFPTRLLATFQFQPTAAVLVRL